AEAKKQRDQARAANAKLERAQGELRRTLYAARSNLIQAAWEADNVARVRELLGRQRPRPGGPDLRGFEWHYWRRVWRAALRTVRLAGLADRLSLNASALSPDGTRLAAAVPAAPGPGFVVRVWDTATGQELRALPLPPGRDDVIYDLAFSPDGRRLALVGGKRGSRGGVLRVWHAATGRELRALTRPSGF